MLSSPTTSELGAIGALHELKLFDLAMEIVELPEEMFKRRLRNLRITVELPDPREETFAALTEHLIVFRKYQLRQKDVEAKFVRHAHQPAHI